MKFYVLFSAMVILFVIIAVHTLPACSVGRQAAWNIFVHKMDHKRTKNFRSWQATHNPVTASSRIKSKWIQSFV